jgi:hypothetical protein
LKCQDNFCQLRLKKKSYETASRLQVELLVFSMVFETFYRWAQKRINSPQRLRSSTWNKDENKSMVSGSMLFRMFQTTSSTPYQKLLQFLGGDSSPSQPSAVSRQTTRGSDLP